MDGGGYGLEAIDNSESMEQSGVDSYGARTVFRTSMLTYGQWTAQAQNNATLQHFEDYCDSTVTSGPYDCTYQGTAYFGEFHVGVWLRDTWNHMPIQDATFNESAWAGIMIDSMGGDGASGVIKGIHFQNGGKNGNASGNLANIAIGSQAPASNVYIEQTQSDGDSAVLANIFIAGPNHTPPVSNLVNWQATTAYAPYDVILPTTGNAGGYIFMDIVPGTSAISPPVWPQSSSGTNCVTDGLSVPPITWCNVGTVLPNSLGNSGNMVKAVAIANEESSTVGIYNAVTNNTWTDSIIADYTYQNDGGTIYECSSDTEHPCVLGQGINLVSPLFSSGSPTISSGFGTLPSVTTSNGSASFLVSVGGGGAATTGVLALPVAAHGWNCVVNDITAAYTHQPYNTRQTAYSATSVTVQNQTISTGAAVAWGVNDLLQLSCSAF
jgi:hypothetical protein